MRLFFTIIILVSYFISDAQITNIPDPNFEQALINLGLDVTLDGQVSTSNIDTLTSLNVTSLGISLLSGIEDFTALEELNCVSNNLTSLNVTQNSNLTLLWCNSNNITSLDVSQNTNLVSLYCGVNQISSLDVSNNQILENLACHANLLTSLNISQNPLIVNFSCDFNQLNCLNVKNGNNSNFTSFLAQGNPNLNCIEVDNIAWSSANWTVGNGNIDATASFSTTCSNPCFVGVDEYEFEKSVSSYPNPTIGEITISLDERINSVLYIKNSLGQIIFSKKITNMNNIQLNIDFLPEGVYYFQFEVEDKLITKRIVKL